MAVVPVLSAKFSKYNFKLNLPLLNIILIFLVNIFIFYNCKKKHCFTLSYSPKVALGLFVTSIDLPSLSPDLQTNPSITFDCDFTVPCRWSSTGNTQDRWKLAKGEPDSILWLAATGTVVHPGQF
jgi:hypothetical protein